MMTVSNVNPDSHKVAAEVSKISSQTHTHAKHNRKLQVIASQLCILKYGLIDNTSSPILVSQRICGGSASRLQQRT